MQPRRKIPLAIWLNVAGYLACGAMALLIGYAACWVRETPRSALVNIVREPADIVGMDFIESARRGHLDGVDFAIWQTLAQKSSRKFSFWQNPAGKWMITVYAPETTDSYEDAVSWGIQIDANGKLRF